MKENKKAILFLIIGILIGLIIGIITSNVITKDSPKTDTKEEQKNDEPEIKEDEEDKTITFDNLFASMDISLNDDEILDFINSTSTSGFQSDNLTGNMFQEEISNEFKVIYTISRATWKAFDENETFMASNYGTKVNLKKSTIEKLAKQIFTDVTLPAEITKDSKYGGIFDISCSEDICTYSYTTFGLVAPVISGFEAPLTKEGNSYKVKPIYIEYEKITPLDDNDDIMADIILKDRHDGKIIKTLKQQKLSAIENKEDSRNPYYNSLSKYYTNIPTYTYEFNEENVLLSVKKS